MDRLNPTQRPDLESPGSLASAIRDLAATQAIRNLSAIYSMAVDDHDLETVVRCFTPDGSFTRAGSTTTGHDDLRAFYRMMMERYRTTLHVPEGHVVEIDPRDPDRANGVVTGHGELVMDTTVMMAAYRYTDTYQCVEGRWKFSSRSLAFMYVMPLEQMATGFGGSKRIRWPEQPFAEADIPEGLPTWSSHLDS